MKEKEVRHLALVPPLSAEATPHKERGVLRYPTSNGARLLRAARGRARAIASSTWSRPRRRLSIVPDATGSFVTFYDVVSEEVWTVPVVGWDSRRRTAIVMDLGSAELVPVDVMDDDRDRIACVWSPSTLYEGRPMSASRAEAMLRGWDD